MTIVIHFHQSGYRTSKAYYKYEIQAQLRSEFPKWVSYSRFVSLIPRVSACLQAYLSSRQGPCDGISIIDSTARRMCDNRRIARYRVFAQTAAHGKNSMGWFYGFKLYLVVNTRGDLLHCLCTPSNCDDRQPVPALVEGLFDKVYGDKG